jgi:putative membrane protein
VRHWLDTLLLARAADELPAPPAAKPPSIQPEDVLRFLHIAGNLVWIGAAIAIGFLLVQKEGDPKVRGALARRVHLRLAMPAFAVSFLAALVRTGMDVKYYFVQHHWMHGKLPFALAVIALHHILGARARKMEAGSMQEAGPSGMLTIILAASAIIAAFFAVLRFPN